MSSSPHKPMTRDGPPEPSLIFRGITITVAPEGGILPMLLRFWTTAIDYEMKHNYKYRMHNLLHLLPTMHQHWGATPSSHAFCLCVLMMQCMRDMLHIM